MTRFQGLHLGRPFHKLTTLVFYTDLLIFHQSLHIFRQVDNLYLSLEVMTDFKNLIEGSPALSRRLFVSPQIC